jgi:hypothetical protein
VTLIFTLEAALRWQMPLWRPPKWKVTAIDSLLTPRRGSDGGVEGSKNHDPSGPVRAADVHASIANKTSRTRPAARKAGGPVKVSFFGLPSLPRLSPPPVAKDNGLAVASLLDLAGTKASVVQMRAEAKDYIDIDALITKGKVDLPLALSAAQKLYGPTFNPQITLKALSFFDDGDLRQLPDDMKLRLVTAARNVDLDRLPSLDNPARKIDEDHGHEL